MSIPKIIRKKNNEYILVKEYDRFALYKDMLTGVREAFLYTDLMRAKNQQKQ